MLMHFFSYYFDALVDVKNYFELITYNFLPDAVSLVELCHMSNKNRK